MPTLGLAIRESGDGAALCGLCLINTKHQRIETFRRGKNDLWILQPYTPDAAGQGLFELKSVGLTEQIAAIYEMDV